MPPEEQKRTEIALFRYRLIAPLIDHPLTRGELAAHVRAVAAERRQIPYSQRNTINADTVWSYFARYRRVGFEGLKPRRGTTPAEAGAYQRWSCKRPSLCVRKCPRGARR